MFRDRIQGCSKHGFYYVCNSEPAVLEHDTQAPPPFCFSKFSVWLDVNKAVILSDSVRDVGVDGKVRLVMVKYRDQLDIIEKRIWKYQTECRAFY